MRQRFNIRGGRRFTLVEVLAALVIVALLVGVALPLFNKLTKSKNVDAAATTLQTKLRGCRSKAINDAERPPRYIPPPAPPNKSIEAIGLLIQRVPNDQNPPDTTHFYLYRCRPGNIIDGSWTGLPESNWTLLPNDIYISSGKFTPLTNIPSGTNAIVIGFGGRGQLKKYSTNATNFNGSVTLTPELADSVVFYTLTNPKKTSDQIALSLRKSGDVKQEQP